MFSQFTIANSLPAIPNALNYQKCLLIGNYLMMLSAFVVTASILVNFAFDEFSLFQFKYLRISLR